MKNFEFRAIVAFALMLVIPASQAAGASCDDPDKAKCTIELATGIRMAYLEVGSPSGKAVLLLHGLTDSSRSWSTTMATLHSADPTLHVFALDQRGHGASSMPSGADCPIFPKSCFQLEQFSADVVAFMKQKGLKSATIVGHSMGSFVAQQIAFDRPELVKGIVLVATAPYAKGNPFLRDFVLSEPVLGTLEEGPSGEGHHVTAGGLEFDTARWGPQSG
ncbi:MAG: alpha/beta hydrolase [Proteobacteria bacterium]|nr:alpha/beta hydrolase [Pseudomonadota bacterium]